MPIPDLRARFARLRPGDGRERTAAPERLAESSSERETPPGAVPAHAYGLPASEPIATGTA
jgi:hypothetical protein